MAVRINFHMFDPTLCLKMDMNFQNVCLFLLLGAPAISLGFTILDEIFCECDLLFKSIHWGSHILSSWMVHARCVFVANIHPSRIWMSGSFESVRWNAYVHRRDLGLYFHPKEFLGNGVITYVNSKGKIPSTGKILLRRIEPTMHKAGHIPTSCSSAPPSSPPQPNSFLI